jgi:hypothetical protein
LLLCGSFRFAARSYSLPLASPAPSSIPTRVLSTCHCRLSLPSPRPVNLKVLYFSLRAHRPRAFKTGSSDTWTRVHKRCTNNSCTRNANTFFLLFFQFFAVSIFALISIFISTIIKIFIVIDNISFLYRCFKHRTLVIINILSPTNDV